MIGPSVRSSRSNAVSLDRKAAGVADVRERQMARRCDLKKEEA